MWGFSTLMHSYCQSSIPSLYGRQEQQEYGDRIREVEQASFTPLVFATTGGHGKLRKQWSVFDGRLASLLSQFDCVQPYSGLNEVHTLFFSVALCYSVHSWKPVHLASSVPAEASLEMGHLDGHRDYWVPLLTIFFQLSSTCQLVLGVVERADHLARGKNIMLQSGMPAVTS